MNLKLYTESIIHLGMSIKRRIMDAHRNATAHSGRFVITVGRTALFAFVLVAPLAAPLTASAAFEPLDRACQGAGDAGVCQPEGGNPVLGDTGVLTKAARIITNVTAIAAVIVIVVAGLTMTLSSGNSSTVQTSRDAIIYAAVALAVAALSRAIVEFIIGNIAK